MRFILGKVLITGGYLVLDPNYSGLVLATSARFYVSLADSDKKGIQVFSRQLDFEGEYEFEGEILRRIKGDENKFIETCLSVSLNLLKLSNVSLRVDIQSDNDFYSQYDSLKEMSLEISSDSLRKVPKFNKLIKFHKTGLGSSAALVTSLIAGIMIHFNRSTYDLNVIHNLAQYCHNLAQGKVGSGFDVSSCVFGSQKFTRSIKEIKLDNLSDQFHRHETFELPKPWTLFLGEIHQGSNTPSLVGSVLKWRKEQAEASLELFEQLNALNNKFESCLTNTNDHIVEIPSIFLKIRSCLKQMGINSGVEIEPDSQSRLIDTTMTIPGVLVAGVPGAGGYDAIFAILDGEDTRIKVESLWVKMGVIPLLLKESDSGIKIL